MPSIAMEWTSSAASASRESSALKCDFRLLRAEPADEIAQRVEHPSSNHVT